MVKRENALIILCFAIIYIVWGSTYLFSAFVIQEIEAFSACAYRFCIAGGICFLILSIVPNKQTPTREQIINAVLAGFVFLGLGAGGAIWSLNHLDSGFSALIISAEPLIIVIMMWIYKQTKPASQTMFGIFLGIIGMYLLVSQSEIITGKDQYLGLLSIFLSMIAWGIGSIFVSVAELPKNQFYNTSIQLISGGFTCLLIAIFLGEEKLIIGNLSSKAIGSMIFLIVFGSIAAFTAFNYLLKNVSTEKVVTNTYVNPIIAMILGHLFNEEIVTLQSIVAALVMLSGVFLINSRRTKSKQ